MRRVERNVFSVTLEPIQHNNIRKIRWARCL